MKKAIYSFFFGIHECYRGNDMNELQFEAAKQTLLNTGLDEDIVIEFLKAQISLEKSIKEFENCIECEHALLDKLSDLYEE